MKIKQIFWSPSSGWGNTSGTDSFESDLLFLFGSPESLKQKGIIDEIRGKLDAKIIIGCSTAGEIYDTSVKDNSITATAVKFESSRAVPFTIEISSPEESYNAGESLIRKFPTEGLKHIFVLSDGLNVNGSELVRGMRAYLPKGVSITGGLAGDGDRFKETLVIADDSVPRSKILTAIGFYGERLKVGYGSFGGWDSFGIERVVSRSKNNILYELDGEPALELYKSFLGEMAAHLPSSGLLFPLSLRTESDNRPVVRTILGIDEKEQSLTFAGDIPQGGYVRLMKANINRLIDGAVTAANTTLAPEAFQPQLAILISCVGRKLVLKQLVEEEVEGVKSILGNNTVITGFYSYGEISPFSKDAKCELHNQTMTITAFSEE